MKYSSSAALSMLLGSLVAFRVIMLWVYDNTQSLPLMIVMHISLTGVNMLAQPENMGGVTNFVYDIAGLTAMWIAVAIVMTIKHASPRRSASLGGETGHSAESQGPAWRVPLR